MSASDPLQSLLQSSANIDLFAQSGRYASVAKAIKEMPDGRKVAYLGRRILPVPTESSASQIEFTVNEGERLDQLSYKYLQDSELFYKIADANAAMNPLELTQDPGASIRIDPYG